MRRLVQSRTGLVKTTHCRLKFQQRSRFGFRYGGHGKNSASHKHSLPNGSEFPNKHSPNSKDLEQTQPSGH